MAEKVVETCDVASCKNPSARSFPSVRIKGAELTLKNDDARRANLCKDHYKQFKKATKKDRELERVTW